MDRAVSGRKLVLGCAAFVLLLAVIGMVFVFKETARLRERREALLKESGVRHMNFEFLRGSLPDRVSSIVSGDETIAYWEVYSLGADFDSLVRAAGEELARVDPAIRAPEKRGDTWEYIGSTMQVIIIARAAYPEFNGQGDKVVFDDLPPLVTRSDRVLVRINYKRR